MKFLNPVAMTMNLLEGSHNTRFMLIETFKTVISIMQLHEDDDILHYRASVKVQKMWFSSAQTYKT